MYSSCRRSREWRTASKRYYTATVKEEVAWIGLSVNPHLAAEAVLIDIALLVQLFLRSQGESRLILARYCAERLGHDHDLIPRKLVFLDSFS